MKKGILTPAVIVMILLARCDRGENPRPEETERLTFTIGTICGWCAGGDSLTISKDSTRYESFSPCDDSAYSAGTVTDPAAWKELTGLFDAVEFQKILINTCYYCVDGCDTWIMVTGDSISHRIRFGYRDSLAIQQIKLFVSHLESL